MVRLILLLLLFGLSLLTVFRAPTNGLWYTAIVITEFSWVFAGVVILLLLWPTPADRYNLPSVIVGIASLILLAVPILGAYRISRNLDSELQAAFAPGSASASSGTPFRFTRMITGIGAAAVPFQSFVYNNNSAYPLSLDFYPAKGKGNRPCVVVVHGGSWAGGNSLQLPELNSYLANKGYHIAAINYRLAPAAIFPAPVEDVQTALNYLRAHAEKLSIDPDKVILLGRSAGAQVALTAAYLRQEKGVVGVINFYGPADMIWGYGKPANKWVMDSKKVMETYLGGTYKQLPQQYARSSPIELVSPLAPPTLSIHGENDPLVAYEHSTRLNQKLTQYGVPHYLLSLPWGTHACDYTLNGPSGQLSTYAIEKFIALVTRNK